MEKTAEKRNFKLKMNIACGSDEIRPSMSNVKFENGFMVATDAHILIKAKVKTFSDFEESEVEILNGKYLSSDTFKKVIACKHVVVTEDGIEDMKTKALYKFTEVDSYPNYDAVMDVGLKSPIDEIGITPVVLNRMLKIISTPDFGSCRFSFAAKNKAITITSNNGDFSENDFRAIVMPAQIN